MTFGENSQKTNKGPIRRSAATMKTEHSNPRLSVNLEI